LVCEIEHSPTTFDDYSATTPYGQSKVLLEKMIRNNCHNANYDWIIFRPTSIWGPWFDEPYRDFFNAVLNGSYLHPYNKKIFKSFGYVGNSVFLLEKMVASDRKLHGETIYLSDYESLSILDWANAIRSKNKMSSIKQIPLIFLRLVAYFGTFLQKVGFKRMPLTKFRLNNLLTSTNYNVDALKEYSEELPFSMLQGVEITLDWVNKH
jgi:nucleoside-diphosphate-sugar epimerase